MVLGQLSLGQSGLWTTVPWTNVSTPSRGSCLISRLSETKKGTKFLTIHQILNNWILLARPREFLGQIFETRKCKWSFGWWRKSLKICFSLRWSAANLICLACKAPPADFNPELRELSFDWQLGGPTSNLILSKPPKVPPKIPVFTAGEKMAFWNNIYHLANWPFL